MAQRAPDWPPCGETYAHGASAAAHRLPPWSDLAGLRPRRPKMTIFYCRRTSKDKGSESSVQTSRWEDELASIMAAAEIAFERLYGSDPAR